MGWTSHHLGTLKALDAVSSLPFAKLNVHVLANRTNVLAIIGKWNSLQIPSATRSNDVKNVHRIKGIVVLLTQISCPVEREQDE
jgi:hypothetical protein